MDASSPYAKSFPLAQPADAHWTDTVVTQGHADYCAAHGHATWVEDGVTRDRCPRCGDIITPEPVPAAIHDGDLYPVHAPESSALMLAEWMEDIIVWPMVMDRDAGYWVADKSPRYARTPNN